MNTDAHQLTIPQLREKIEDAQKRIEQLSNLRLIVTATPRLSGEDNGRDGVERIWVVAAMDARRVMLLHNVGRYERFIEMLQEQERQRREDEKRDLVGVLFIDGERV